MELRCGWSHAHNHSFSYLTNIDKAHLQRYVSVVDANIFITESIVIDIFALKHVSWNFNLESQIKLEQYR